MAEQATGGPRKIAEQNLGKELSGEPKGYCGTCGLPDSSCDCGSYKEWGGSSQGGGTKKPKEK